MSWIRSRDLRILSIGEIRYTRDSRFTPLHDAGNDVWALMSDMQVAYVRRHTQAEPWHTIGGATVEYFKARP